MSDGFKEKIMYERLKEDLAQKTLEQEAGTNSMFSRVGDKGFYFAVAFISIALTLSVAICCSTVLELVRIVLEYAKAGW